MTSPHPQSMQNNTPLKGRLQERLGMNKENSPLVAPSSGGKLSTPGGLFSPGTKIYSPALKEQRMKSPFVIKSQPIEDDSDSSEDEVIRLEEEIETLEKRMEAEKKLSEMQIQAAERLEEMFQQNDEALAEARRLRAQIEADQIAAREEAMLLREENDRLEEDGKKHQEEARRKTEECQRLEEKNTALSAEVKRLRALLAAAEKDKNPPKATSGVQTSPAAAKMSDTLLNNLSMDASKNDSFRFCSQVEGIDDVEPPEWFFSPYPGPKTKSRLPQ